MIIYKITNLINGKIYIGQTVVKISVRWKQHCANHAKNCIGYAISKYGAENFSIEKIDEASTIEEMNIKEATYIKALKTIAPNGYNLKAGGSDHRQHAETRAKMSASAKKRIKERGDTQFREALKKAHAAAVGREPWNKGKKASEQAKKNQSISHLGQDAWNKGLKTPQDVREKQRKAKESFSLQVYCPELNKTWSSACACAAELGFSDTHIRRLYKSGKRTNEGLSFRVIGIAKNMR